jgi:hypothetical protein
VIVGVGGRELLVLVDFEEGGEFHCFGKGRFYLGKEWIVLLTRLRVNC